MGSTWVKRKNISTDGILLEDGGYKVLYQVKKKIRKERAEHRLRPSNRYGKL